MEPRKSVLDARTSSMWTRFAAGESDIATVPLSTLGERFASTGGFAGQPAASDAVTLKLVVDRGTEDKVGEWVKERGGNVTSSGERVLVADLSVKRFSELDGVQGLRRVEASQEFHIRLEDARGTVTGLDQFMDSLGTAGRKLTGKGVIVGIIDTGVDWSHQDFIDEAGESRMELFVHAFLQPNTSLSEIVEYDRTALNAALKVNSSKKKTAVPAGDPHGHGTHCASIAAGNGRASAGRFRGVAPDATLVGMRSEPLLDDHIIEGIRRIFRAAGARPAVVNLSLGGHIGAHDGTSAIENVIARETGPGHIVVVAAGNEGEDQIHWSGTLSKGQDLVIPFRMMDRSAQIVDVWVPRGDEVDIFIEDPDGNHFAPDGIAHPGSAGELTADWRVDQVNRDQNLTVTVVGGSIGARWQIHITPVNITQGEVHAWAQTSKGSALKSIFPSAGDGSYTIGIPATEERAISVASFVSRATVANGAPPGRAAGLQVGQLSPFSSRGPSRIGSQCPHIAAPGQFITAALASNSSLATDPRYAARRDASGRYVTIQGTSMATPFVTGVIALMLEREPKLDPSEIQQRLRATGTRDATVGRVWHQGFGYGRIDVPALMKYRAFQPI